MRVIDHRPQGFDVLSLWRPLDEPGREFWHGEIIYYSGKKVKFSINCSDKEPEFLKKARFYERIWLFCFMKGG
jgi:hypothetical protein